MAIQRWDPQRDLVRLQVGVNRMFEEADRFVMRADLPGLAPSDVEIRIEKARLLLAGERKSDQAAYLRMERPFGRFSAQIALPSSVDPDGIRATHCNGVLEVLLPKKKEEARGRIEVAGS
jgi:HSP20 family protein